MEPALLEVMEAKLNLTRRQVLYSAPFALAGLPSIFALFGCGDSSQFEQTTQAAAGSQQPTEEDQQINETLEQLHDEHEGEISSYMQTANIGETVALANMDVEVTVTNYITGEEIKTKMPDFVPWDGTLEVSIDGASTYESIQDAASAESLGTIIKSAPTSGQSAFILVVHMTLTYVDATSRRDDGLFNTDAFNPTYTLADAAYPASFRSAIASFDGAVEEAKTNEKLLDCFSLNVGETKSLTAGWWVDGDCDMSTLQIRPSLSATDQGPIIFDLGLSDSDAPAV